MSDSIEALRIHVETLGAAAERFKEETDDMDGCEMDAAVADLLHSMACAIKAQGEALHAHLMWHKAKSESAAAKPPAVPQY